MNINQIGEKKISQTQQQQQQITTNKLSKELRDSIKNLKVFFKTTLCLTPLVGGVLNRLKNNKKTF